MIKVFVGDNINRKAVIVDPGTTLRQVLDENNVDYSRRAVSLDGATLQPGDLDKTFHDFGITTQTFLLALSKTDNA